MGTHIVETTPVCAQLHIYLQEHTNVSFSMETEQTLQVYPQIHKSPLILQKG